jgi:hypothetical protein
MEVRLTPSVADGYRIIDPLKGEGYRFWYVPLNKWMLLLNLEKPASRKKREEPELLPMNRSDRGDFI